MVEFETLWYGRLVYQGHAESKWTHLICTTDWNRLNPLKKVHENYGADNEPEPCCWCGALTGNGIYYRLDPDQVHIPQGIATA